MKDIAKQALKKTTTYVFAEDIYNLTEEEFDIWIDCMWSDVHADILMLVMEQEIDYVHSQGKITKEEFNRCKEKLTSYYETIDYGDYTFTYKKWK